MPLRRQTGLILLALLIAAALAYGFWPKPIPVSVALVKRAALEVTVEEEGRTRVIDRYVVSTPVAGIVGRIDSRVGDTVEQGQVLARLGPLASDVLDPRSHANARAGVAMADAALKAAQEVVQAAQADADIARAEARRIAVLAEGKLVSEDERDRAEAQRRHAEAQLRSARFNVQVAQYELEAARTALNYSAARASEANGEHVLIRAPVAGQVLVRYRESEGVVGAGTALLELGDPRALEVVADVLSADAVRIAPGTAVYFDRWGGHERLHGQVRRVEPTGFTKVSALGVEEQRVLVIIDILSPPEQWQRLGDGYRLETSFVLWRGEDVLQVPASALFRYADGWGVFVIDEGRAVRREVAVGQRNGLVAEIVSGLSKGERVISHPDDTIEDGVRVSHERQ